MPEPEILVVGGGPAGLAAAFRLHEAGHRVRILEAGDRVGSKMASTRRDGFLIDRGAVFLPTTYRNLLGLAADAGLADAFVDGCMTLGVVRDRFIHEIDAAAPAQAFLRTKGLTRRGKLGAVRLAPEALRSRKAVPDRITEAGGYDRTTLETWSRANLSAEVRHHLVEPMIRGIFAAEPGEVSRVEFLGILALFAGAGMTALREGMSAYPERLARSLDVVLGARVREVRQTPAGADVTWIDAAAGERTESVAGCVVALNARDARAMRPDLDAWRAQYLDAVRVGPLVLPNLALDRTPRTHAAYALIPRSEHPDLGGIGFDHNKAPGRTPSGKGLLTLTFMNDWSARHFDDGDDDLVSAAMAAAEQIVPGIADQVLFAEINRWTQQYNPVGHYAKLGEFRVISARLDRTVKLCGEYLSAPNLNAATASGELAAAELAAELDGHRPA